MDGMMKNCTYCGKTKPLSGFYKHPTTAMGVGNRCRMCHSERNRKIQSATKELRRVKVYIKEIRELIKQVDELLGRGE